MDRLSYIMHNFYSITFLPYAIYNKEGMVQCCPDSNDMRQIASLFPESLLHTVNSADYIAIDGLLCFGIVRIEASDNYILLGPASEVPCDKNNIRKIQTRFRAYHLKASQIADFFKQVPCYSDIKFASIVSFFNYVLHGDMVSLYRIPPQKTAIISEEVFDYNLKLPHNSKQYEKELFSFIKYGQPEKLKSFLQNTAFNGNAGIYAADFVRKVKNWLICASTLASHAAIDGGLDYETAMEKAELYVQKIEASYDTDMMYHLNMNMLIEFANLVAQINYLNPTTPIAHKVSNYIRAHLNQTIKVEDMAKDLQMNSTYLCHCFKKDMRITPSKYIALVKTNEAKRLLESSELNLAEISFTLGYSSQGHFQNVFKSCTGLTPNEYRCSSEKDPCI